jgi:Cu(I)/Ag(I) efflux system periplasmic protein CusF
MRKMSLIAASAVALAMTGLPMAVSAQTLFDGTVRKIDQSAGKITLRHGPIKKLEMDEPMTMVFRVQDPAMLTQVKVGDKVKFDADRVTGQITVTKIQKVK